MFQQESQGFLPEQPFVALNYNRNNNIVYLGPIKQMVDLECMRFQSDEFRALETIYLDEFHKVKQSFPQKFDILCYPYRGNKAEYQIKIMFEFTNTYPKSPLKYEIEPITGLTRDNIIVITNKIEDIIYNNRSKPVVYDIVEEIRIWIEEYLVGGKAYMQEQQIKVKVQQHFERPKFAAFTPVTFQSFSVWKKQFDLKNKLKKAEKKEGEQKMTGKEWFLGKNQIDDDEDEDQQDEQYDEQDEEIEEEKEKVYIPRQENNDLF